MNTRGEAAYLFFEFVDPLCAFLFKLAVLLRLLLAALLLSLQRAKDKSEATDQTGEVGGWCQRGGEGALPQ